MVRRRTPGPSPAAAEPQPWPWTIGTKPSMPGKRGSSSRLATSAMRRHTVTEQFTEATMPMKLRVPTRPSARR
jgi:hypothetical protein